MSLRICPDCGAKGKCHESRRYKDHVRRCYSCPHGHRWTTAETLVRIHSGRAHAGSVKEHVSKLARVDQCDALRAGLIKLLGEH